MFSYFPFFMSKDRSQIFYVVNASYQTHTTNHFIHSSHELDTYISMCMCVVDSLILCNGYTFYSKKVSWWFYPPFLYFLIDDSSTWNKLFRLKWFQKTMNPSNHFMLPMRETTTYRKKNVVELEKVENFTCVIFYTCHGCGKV